MLSKCCFIAIFTIYDLATFSRFITVLQLNFYVLLNLPISPSSQVDHYDVTIIHNLLNLLGSFDMYFVVSYLRDVLFVLVLEECLTLLQLNF